LLTNQHVQLFGVAEQLGSERLDGTVVINVQPQQFERQLAGIFFRLATGADDIETLLMKVVGKHQAETGRGAGNQDGLCHWVVSKKMRGEDGSRIDRSKARFCCRVDAAAAGGTRAARRSPVLTVGSLRCGGPSMPHMLVSIQ